MHGGQGAAAGIGTSSLRRGSNSRSRRSSNRWSPRPPSGLPATATERVAFAGSRQGGRSPRIARGEVCPQLRKKRRIHATGGSTDATDQSSRRLRCASETLRRLTWTLLILPVLAGLARADELPPDPVNPKGHVGDVLALGFTPDGETLITTGADGLAKIWDVATTTVRADLIGHDGKVLRVAISADGKTIATGGEDRTVRLWSTTDGARLGTLSGHSAAVTALAFAPDGKTLASGSPDTTIRLWDVAARRALRTLEGHDAGVQGLAFSPDGKTLASASRDGTIKLWDVIGDARSRSLASRKNRFAAWRLPLMVRPSSQVAWTRWCGFGRSASPNRSRLRNLNHSRVKQLRKRNRPRSRCRLATMCSRSRSRPTVGRRWPRPCPPRRPRCRLPVRSSS